MQNPPLPQPSKTLSKLLDEQDTADRCPGTYQVWAPAEKLGRVRSGPDPLEFNLELYWGLVNGNNSTATYRTLGCSIVLRF
jgi:hypothetical protein